MLALLWVSSFTYTVIAQTTTAPDQQSVDAKTSTIAETGESDPFIQLNSEFRKLYAEARNYKINHCGPVIVISGNKAIFVDGSKRNEVRLTSADYDIFKIVDHATLGTYVALERFTGKPLPPPAVQSLQTLQHCTQEAMAQLNTLSLPPATLARQKELLQNVISFIEKVLAAKTVSADTLNSFIAGQTPWVMANADEAAAIELSNLDKQMQIWKNNTEPARWKRLHVVVCDEHMPRQDERYMQYFLQLFNEKNEGHHVVYQEGNFDENKALQLLGTHLLDTSIAKAFFRDPNRMHRDLLSDSARKYLKQHPAQQ